MPKLVKTVGQTGDKIGPLFLAPGQGVEIDVTGLSASALALQRYYAPGETPVVVTTDLSAPLTYTPAARQYLELVCTDYQGDAPVLRFTYEEA